MLSGKYDSGVPEGSRFAQQSYAWLKDKMVTKETIAKVKQLEPIAKELGVTRAQLALAWCLKNPHVSFRVHLSRGPPPSTPHTWSPGASRGSTANRRRYLVPRRFLIDTGVDLERWTSTRGTASRPSSRSTGIQSEERARPTAMWLPIQAIKAAPSRRTEGPIWAQ